MQWLPEIYFRQPPYYVLYFFILSLKDIGEAQIYIYHRHNFYGFICTARHSDLQYFQ